MSILKRISFVANFSKKSDNVEKGEAGEYFARQYLNDRNIKFINFPQDQDAMKLFFPGLSKVNGKRPDFAIELSGEIIYLDAKFHKTNDLKEFKLSKEEVNKYKAFRGWVKDALQDPGPRMVVFMLFPQECNGQRLVFVALDDFNGATHDVIGGEPALKIDLTKHPTDLWDLTVR